jgi:hypothetical protein
MFKGLISWLTTNVMDLENFEELVWLIVCIGHHR